MAKNWLKKYQQGGEIIPFEEYYKHVPEYKNDTSGYDLRGYYNDNPKGAWKFANSEHGHAPDTYKKPNHITFSNQSKYSTPSNPGGRWAFENNQDVFYATLQNIKNAGGIDKLQKYFQEQEKGVKLVLPKKQSGGKISTTGYKADSPDKNEPILTIPSNRITMQGVDYPIMAYPSAGKGTMMHPGGEYYFPYADYVTEVPIAQQGWSSSDLSKLRQATANWQPSPYQDMDPAMLQQYKENQRVMQLAATPQGRVKLKKEAEDKKYAKKKREEVTKDKEIRKELQEQYARDRFNADPSIVNPEYWQTDPVTGRTPQQRLDDMGTDLQTRVFRGGTDFIDNNFNPAVWIAGMAGNLAKAPLKAQQENSVMPYVSAIGEPLAFGAGEEIVEPYIKKAFVAAKPYYTEAFENIKQGINNFSSKYGPQIKQTVGDIQDALTPGKLKQYTDKKEDIFKNISSLEDQKSILIDEIYKTNQKVHDYYEKTGRVPSNEYANKLYNLEKQLNYIEDIKQRGYEKEGELFRSVKTFKEENKNAEPIVNFITGETIYPEIETPGQLLKYSKKGKDVTHEVLGSSDVKISEPYQKTVQSNVDHIENITGGKVFGSAKGVSSANFPHATGDYDVLISEENYNKNVKGKLDYVTDKGFAKTHSLGDKFGEQGHIDFNIIESDPKTGYAKGQRAEQLFRQFAPDEFAEAAKESIKTGEPLKIKYKPDELIEKMNPTVKTIMDAYESPKPKHVLRIDKYINYANPDRVLEAQNQYVKSLVGSKGILGHQFPIEQLSNPDVNKTILEHMDFAGDIEYVSKDPKRMQLVLNDYYINNTILSRGINRETDFNFIKSALTEWDPEKGGGQLSGAGLNNVMLGEAYHGEGGIYSNKQLNIGNILKTDDPLTYISTIKKATDGNIPFTLEEGQKVVDILKENNIEYDTRNIKSPRSLIEYLAYNPKAKLVLDKVSDATGLRIIGTRNYGNSKYATMIGNFNDELDALMYGLKEHVPGTKSLLQRRMMFKETNKASVNKSMNAAQFNRIKNYLTNAKEVILNRIKKYKDEEHSLYSDIERLQEIRTKHIREKISENIKKQHHLNDLIKEIHRKQKVMENLRPLIIGGGAATSIIGAINYGLNNKFITRGQRSGHLSPSGKRVDLNQNYNKEGMKYGGTVKKNLLQNY